MQSRIDHYFSVLADLPRRAIITDRQGQAVPTAQAYEAAISAMCQTHERGNKLIFIGNGGSAGIASHCAIDYSKNGNIRATALSDSAALTCLANDLGYENVFAKQIDLHAREGDLLMAISSSGQSPNIVKAVETAYRRGCTVYTFSGFSEGNPLRKMGHLNFYVHSGEYGFVEISHLALIHSLLDLKIGWGKSDAKI